jgi:gliding-associated putative ABC transporter substrate-binding component GldG
MKNRGISLLLIAGIVVVVNLLSSQFFARLDITEDRQYTLSPATKSIMRNLDEPVSVQAYFSQNLPAEFENLRKEFQDMLIEYRNLSKGNLDYNFVDPNEDPQAEQEALQGGIRPILINVRDKDQSSQQKAFMGAVISLGDQQEVIPFISTETPMEYSLTTSIKKISVIDKPSIGFIGGHGEPALSDLGQAIQALSVIFSIENIDLNAETSIPDRYRAVVLLNPADSIPNAHFAKIDDYLARGGKVVAAVNAVTGDFSTAQGTAVENNVFDWLASKGVQVEGSFAIDANCGSVSVQQRQGFFTISTPVQFPFLPIVTTFPEHPATKGLEQVSMQFVSPVEFIGESGTFVPLLLTSNKSGIIHAPTFFDVSNKKWGQNDFPLSNIVVGGVVEGVGGVAASKLVVFGDGDFPISQGGRGANPDNVSLLVNTIEWLSDDTGLSALRTKGVSSRPIDTLEDGKRTFLKFLNFFLPIVLALGYGIFRSQRNRSIRMRRMQERYV